MFARPQVHETPKMFARPLILLCIACFAWPPAAPTGVPRAAGSTTAPAAPEAATPEEAPMYKQACDRAGASRAITVINACLTQLQSDKKKQIRMTKQYPRDMRQVGIIYASDKALSDAYLTII